MRSIQFLFLLVSILIANISVAFTAVNSDAYVLYAEPQAGIQPLMDSINGAKQEIDVVMYLFSDHRLAKGLANAASRGVKVKVLLDKAPYKSMSNTNALRAYFDRQGVQYHVGPSAKSHLNFFHEKMMLIDHKTAWVMTANFTYSSFNLSSIERNFILQDSNVNDVTEVQKVFDEDWLDEGAPNVPVTTHLVVSPINARAQLTQVVSSAQKSLDIYAEALIDYDFIGALANAASQGVVVRVIIDTKLKPKAETYLQQHHIQIHYTNPNFKNHAKLMVADGHEFYLGSINFTQNSFDANRELGVRLDNPVLASALSQQFAEDWLR